MNHAKVVNVFTNKYNSRISKKSIGLEKTKSYNPMSTMLEDFRTESQFIWQKVNKLPMEFIQASVNVSFFINRTTTVSSVNFE